ncbi:MAG: arginine--tRNA ligase, partial [Pseudomonadota bacterium]
MKEHIIELIAHALTSLKAQGILSDDAPLNVHIEQTKNPEHGDLASNVALSLKKHATSGNPRKLASAICDALPESKHVIKTDIAGPGFINFYLNTDSQTKIISTILAAGDQFGRNTSGNNISIQVEFVSANPTGPLHVGHGRGAAYGACVSNLLEACGYQVQREYYVNDAGRQMDILGTSIWLRYLQAHAESHNLSFDFPSNGYKGDYIIEYAERIKTQYGAEFVHSRDAVFKDVCDDEPQGGDKELHIDDLIRNAKQLLNEHYETVFEIGLNAILDDIRDDLIEFKVPFDCWFSEKSLVQYGEHKEDLMNTVIQRLHNNNHIEERDGALWFLSSKLGDDKDRVIKRSNGQTTYFASDIAYHYEKFARGFDRVINIWGADHHGYIARIKAALQALDIDPDRLEVKLVQLVSLYRGDEKVSMSTRSGEFVTLKELREEVGNDAARFFYVMRKVEQASDFDLDLAKSQSQENPVYYVQYAYARIASVLKKLTETGQQYT